MTSALQQLMDETLLGECIFCGRRIWPGPSKRVRRKCLEPECQRSYHRLYKAIRKSRAVS